jgi:tRNA(Ile)-lysidine synthase
MNKKFLDFIDDLNRKYPSETFALAISGGVDSIALLYWFAKTGLPCVALTVDHGLRPESANESASVSASAATLGIAHQILHWTGDKPSTGLEAAARKARYELMFDYCNKNNIGILLTAHQADDQIETFLMNLGRGSGVYGLAGIRPISQRGGIIIARPLLDVPRAQLQNYCDENNIKYFNDEMNDDENFTRVRIRKNRKVLTDALGISDERILLAMSNLHRVREAMENDVEKLIASASEQLTARNEKRFVFPAAMLFGLPAELQLKFLAQMLKRIGGAEYSPRLGDIQRLIVKLSSDTMATLSHCVIRRLRDKILIAHEGESISFAKHKKI